MFRSIWFWVLLLGLGLLFLMSSGAQIASIVQSVPMQAIERKTNTRNLAAATPQSAAPTSITTGPGTPGTTGVPSPRAITATPGTSAPTVPVPTQRASYRIYVVRKGDTLYSIAKRYHTDVPTLRRINHIQDPRKLKIGQELKIPQSNVPASIATPGVKPGTRPYKVRPGDTLSSIARELGVSVPELQRLNQLSNPNQLKAGTTILVPARAATSVPSGNPPTTTAAPTPPHPQATEEMVHTLPALTPTPGSAPAVSSAPTPTPTPLPTLPSVCGGDQEAVFVWGVSFCVPPGWALEEYASPHRTALLIRHEPTGDLSLFAISHLEGSPNAPLSWTMRQAKESLSTEIDALIPGHLTPPQNWSVATSFQVANVQGQMSEAVTTYARSKHPAHVRVIVFNAAGKRWRMVMITPESLWQSYMNTVFPYIIRTLEVY